MLSRDPIFSMRPIFLLFGIVLSTTVTSVVVAWKFSFSAPAVRPPAMRPPAMRPLPLEVPQFPGFRRLEDAEVPSGKKVLVDADAPKSKDDEPGDAPKRDDAERPDDGRIPKAKSEDDGPGSHILPRPGPM